MAGDSQTGDQHVPSQHHHATLREAAEACRRDIQQHHLPAHTAEQRQALGGIESAKLHHMGFPNLDIVINRNGHMLTTKHGDPSHNQHDWGQAEPHSPHPHPLHHHRHGPHAAHRRSHDVPRAASTECAGGSAGGQHPDGGHDPSPERPRQGDTTSDQQERHRQAEQLAPSGSQVGAALTADVRQKLAAAGLNADDIGRSFHSAMAQRMEQDHGLPDLARLRQFPVGAALVASGAVTPQQMDRVLAQQQTVQRVLNGQLPAGMPTEQREAALRLAQSYGNTVPTIAQVLQRFAQADVTHFDRDKIAAANAFIESLRGVQRRQQELTP